MLLISLYKFLCWLILKNYLSESNENYFDNKIAGNKFKNNKSHLKSKKVQ